MKTVSLSIDVPDVDTAVDFFVSGLGFSKLRDEPPKFVVLAAGTLEIWLLPRVDGSRAVPDSSISRTYKRHWTPIHLDVVVDDLQAALKRAIRAGAVQEGNVVSDEQGSIAFCSDPFGNGFCLIEE